MRRWAVVFQNFGGPRLVRKTYTRRGAERIVERLRAEAPVGAKTPSQHLHIESRSDRHRQMIPWLVEQEHRHEPHDATAGHAEMLAVRL